MVLVHAPPTKVLSSKPLSPAQAHAFLTSFTTAADAAKNDTHNGHNEIVLTNLKRIEQALIGIHVPRPVQGDLDIEGLTDMTAPIMEQIVPVEGEGEEQENIREENGEDNIDALEDVVEEVRNTVIPVVKADGKTRADKKAAKKARRKEEKKQRAELRKEKEDSEGSE